MNSRSGTFDFLVEDPLDAKPRAYAFGIVDIFMFLRRRWLLIGLIATIVVVLTGSILATIQPRYSATAELTLVDQRQQSTPIADLLTGVPLSRQLVAQEITTMSSKAFMIEVVKRLESDDEGPILEQTAPPILPVKLLQDLKKFISSLVSPPPAPQTVRVEQVAEAAEALENTEGTDVDAVGDDALSADFEVLAEDPERYGDIADKLGGILRIAQLGNGYVIGISAQSGDPKVAARIANTAAMEYTRFSLNIRSEAIEQQVQLLSARVEELGRNLEEAETAVVDFQGRVMGVNSDNMDRLSRQIEDFSRRSVEADTVVTGARARYQNVFDIVSEDGYVTAAAVLSSPILVDVRSELSQLRIERSRAVEQFGASSGQVSAIDAVVKRIAQEIEIETARIVSEYETELNVAQAIAATIRRKLVGLEEAMGSRSRNMVELSKLRRIADANRIAYEEFLSIATESAQYKALQQPTIRVLSFAEEPSVPSSPRTLLTLAASGLAGLLIGIGVSILIEAVNNKVMTSGQLRSVSGLPVIGSFSRIGAFSAREIRNGMISGPGRRTSRGIKLLTAEGRKMAQFLTSALERDRSTIVVTSAVSGEGSSATAFLLANALSSRAESVLLIDATGVGHHLGFSISDAVTLDIPGTSDITRTDAGFHFLSLSDATLTTPSLLPKRWKAGLMDTLVGQYRYVVIDTPPVLSSAGGLGFVRDADAIVIAARWNSTARQTIDACVERLSDLKAKNMYMVMTMVKRRRERKYEYLGFKQMFKTGNSHV